MYNKLYQVGAVYCDMGPHTGMMRVDVRGSLYMTAAEYEQFSSPGDLGISLGEGAARPAVNSMSVPPCIVLGFAGPGCCVALASADTPEQGSALYAAAVGTYGSGSQPGPPEYDPILLIRIHQVDGDTSRNWWLAPPAPPSSEQEAVQLDGAVLAGALGMIDEASVELARVNRLGADETCSERDAYTGALEALADVVRAGLDRLPASVLAEPGGSQPAEGKL